MEVQAPLRVRHEHTQKLVGPAEAVFPLLCPVREAEWVKGWDPVAVYTTSGVAERDCVFITSADGVESTWYITLHDPENFRVEMIKLAPGITVAKLEFAVEPAGASASKLHVAYTFTALSDEGREVVAAFDKEQWDEFMRTEFDGELNHFLATGNKEKEKPHG